MAVEYDHPQEEELSRQCREPTLEDLVALCGWLNAEQARYVVVGGFAIPFASPPGPWRMKQTLREKDISDKIFLRRWAEKFDVQLDLPTQSATPGADSWRVRLARRIEHLFSNKKS